ncbi:SGNH/GDSL hydrolase family protein [Providencia rettgeri]|uniref:SGNH/GDSL hydrolase family protein n=1 Tax=Providencia rettgeri TaxID=587 RepID=UPI001EE6A434|nr:SGNH/GDSL hydrolase family protein [Providencia rettgeri]MCG5278414.1 SGNH/GDSL hydrolase family protein [Providencia rettgeri]MCG9509878.1 SGNH/GDSL hydrolase family protein [Providencia rettgeri]
MNKSFPASSYVENTRLLIEELANSDKVLHYTEGNMYAFGITDKEGRMALGIKESGQVDVSSLGLSTNGTELVNLNSDEYTCVFTDAIGAMCLGIKTDGTVEIPKLDATGSSGSQHIFYIDGSKLQVIDVNTGAIKVIDDGTIAIISSNDSVVYSKESITFIATPPEFKPIRLAPSLDIVCWGDSMTAGVGGESENVSYPSALAAELGVSVSKKGYGGQASTDIAVRQGGTQLTISYTGTISPASTVSVLVTPTDYYRAIQISYSGNIADTPVKMMKSAAGEWELKNEGSEPLEIAGKATFIGNEGKNEREKTAIFWIGRNNQFWNNPEPIFRDIAAMINYLNVSLKRSIVISLCNTAAEPKGSSRYNAMLDINSRLAQVYGDKFIDVRTYLITKGLSDAGIAPTTQDVTDISNDIIPTSLRSDDTHLNATGYALVGKYIAKQLKNKGWY